MLQLRARFKTSTTLNSPMNKIVVITFRLKFQTMLCGTANAGSGERTQNIVDGLSLDQPVLFL
jgi:hypothetical protein